MKKYDGVNLTVQDQGKGVGTEDVDKKQVEGKSCLWLAHENRHLWIVAMRARGGAVFRSIRRV